MVQTSCEKPWRVFAIESWVRMPCVFGVPLVSERLFFGDAASCFNATKSASVRFCCLSSQHVLFEVAGLWQDCCCILPVFLVLPLVLFVIWVLRCLLSSLSRSAILILSFAMITGKFSCSSVLCFVDPFLYLTSLLYKTLIHPCLEYAGVMSRNYTSGDSFALEHVQLCLVCGFLRSVCGLSFYACLSKSAQFPIAL